MIRCPVCESPVSEQGGKPYPGADGNELGLSSIVFCGTCGLGMAAPMPSDERLDEYYASSAFWGDSAKVISGREDASMLEQANSRWRYLDRHVRLAGAGLRVLDVGAGLGCFGLVADARVARYVAVEPDAGMRAALADAWASFGRKAALETLASLDQAEGVFDLIVCTHVLEHLTSPCRFMADMRSHLGQGGVCFFETPYRDDLFKQGLFPHLLFYSPESMKEALHRSGLEAVDVRVVGAPRSLSPLNREAPGRVHRRGALLQRGRRFLPLWLLRRLYSLHYQWDVPSEDGVWLRTLGRLR